jgi:zinc transporter, ZIP family
MTYLLPVLAVIWSFCFTYITQPRAKIHLQLLLAFSGAFLLALTIFELFPSVYSQADPKLAGIFIILGILLQIFLEFFSKGAEHGHVPADDKAGNFPWILFISLSVHAFLEGFPVDKHHNIIYGIIVHKIPISVILSIFLLESKLKLRWTALFILSFSLMTPLGTLIAAYVPVIQHYNAYATAMVIGIFLHISTVILFESSEGHKFNIRKVTVIILGVMIAYLI